ncbi:hypothetical protein [Pantoea cypripedii]|uniref:Pathogenicity island effector protein n=1 Tax=Pantoea cypripedii TaxID=55209 RepID=A0A6B9GD78_PANCY|nr:hypothetical protein [Pantoea cypripedii]QGY32167.1 hypothetical protein CUN67_24550 [Pantoea cypripedii]
MSEVNSVNSTASYQRSADFGSGISGEGLIGLMDHVMEGLQKMGNDMRDVHRQFAEQGVGIKYEKMATAMKTKQDAIELNYKANMANANGKMWSGALSVAGSVIGIGGGFKEGKSNAITSGFGGFGKIAEGLTGKNSARYTKEAGEKELLGDYQTTLSEDFNKILTKAVEEAKNASGGVKDMLNEFGKLQQALFGAVQLR